MNNSNSSANPTGGHTGAGNGTNGTSQPINPSSQSFRSDGENEEIYPGGLDNTNNTANNANNTGDYGNYGGDGGNDADGESYVDGPTPTPLEHIASLGMGGMGTGGMNSVTPKSRVSMSQVAVTNGISPLVLTPLYKLDDTPTPNPNTIQTTTTPTPVNRLNMTPKHGGTPHYMASKHEITPRHGAHGTYGTPKPATPLRPPKEALTPYMMSDHTANRSNNVSDGDVDRNGNGTGTNYGSGSGFGIDSGDGDDDGDDRPDATLGRYDTEFILGDQMGGNIDNIDSGLENVNTSHTSFNSEVTAPHPHTLLSTSMYSNNMNGNGNGNELNDMQIRLLVAGSIFIKLGKMPLMVSSNKQLRYVCVTNDLKYLRWKHMLTNVSNKLANERLSPIPSHRSVIDNEGSSVLALDQVESIEMEVVDKFLLWTSNVTSKESIANNKNYSYFLIIKGYPANNSELKSLKLEFFSASYPWENESKYRMTMLWIDSLKIAVKQAKKMNNKNHLLSNRQERGLGSHLIQESTL